MSDQSDRVGAPADELSNRVSADIMRPDGPLRSQEIVIDRLLPPRANVARRAVLFPDLYVWFVLLASLDIMLTWVILALGGREVNVLADWIIRLGKLPGVVIFKFACVMTLIAICEVVGRVRPVLGRPLALWAVAMTALPVIVALLQMAIFGFGPGESVELHT